jgi:hypothetical protein
VVVSELVGLDVHMGDARLDHTNALLQSIHLVPQRLNNLLPCTKLALRE